MDEIRRLISPRERSSLLNYAWVTMQGTVNGSDDRRVDGVNFEQGFVLDGSFTVESKENTIISSRLRI